MRIRCPKCGTEFKEKFAKDEDDGETIICPKCGSKIYREGEKVLMKTEPKLK